MFMKRFQSSGRPSKSNNQENNGGHNINRKPCDAPSNTSEKKKTKGFWSKQPTIIRANEDVSRPFCRKKRPPRPPPPKYNTSGCVSAFSLHPPSYEEVLLADAKSKNLRHKRPAPLRPNNESNCKVSHSNESALVDAKSISKSENNRVQLPQLEEIHELEDIFNNWSMINSSSTTASVNNSNPTPLNNQNTMNLFDDNTNFINFNEFEAPMSNSNFQSETVGDTRTFEDLSGVRPVPLPRWSLTCAPSNSGLPNMSESYIKCENQVMEPTNRKTSENVPPSLPPRPTQLSTTDLEDFENQDSIATPTLPPKPANYNDASQVLDESDNSLQRMELEPHGIALHDYFANQSDELSFKVNEMVTLIHPINDQWLYGCVGEQEGMFPRNFIQIIIPLPDDPEFQNDDNQSLTKSFQCIAMFDYIGCSAEELTFEVGDTILSASKVNEHWLKGSVRGQTGLVPSSYVKIIDTLPEDANLSEDVQVMYDFKAEFVSELDCKSGDMVKIIQPVDDEWVMVQLGEKCGMIPWNFLDTKHHKK